MSYVTAAKRPNPVAAMGALGVPAAFAGLLIVGLAVKAVAPEIVANPDVFDVPIAPEIEDIPEPVETPTTTTEKVTPPETTYTPPPRPNTDYTFSNSASEPIGTLVDPGPILTPSEPVNFGIPTPSPLFDPIDATPRGNPGNWVTNNDYRTSWINRGFEGSASFTLMIDARGRVSGCTITRSTGHSALDDATCSLLERRGRFDPAKDSSGNATSGTFRSSITWTIPE